MRSRVRCELRARFDSVGVIFAGRLDSFVVDRHIAVCLRTEGGVLRRDEHGDAVVDGEDDERKEDGSHEESLWGRVALADGEEHEPEKADSHGSNAYDGGGEKEEGEKEEDNVVDGEDLRCLDEDPIDGLEDVDVTKNITASGFANGVLGFVDARDEHGDEDEEAKDHEKYTAEEFDWPEYCTKFVPDLDKPGLALATCFCCKPLSPIQCTLFPGQRFQFAAVSRIESPFTPFIAHLKLSLSFTVLL